MVPRPERRGQFGSDFGPRAPAKLLSSAIVEAESGSETALERAAEFADVRPYPPRLGAWVGVSCPRTIRAPHPHRDLQGTGAKVLANVMSRPLMRVSLSLQPSRGRSDSPTGPTESVVHQR